MLVFKFGADLVTFNHAAGPSLLFLVLLFFMDSTRGGGGTEPRYRGGGALGGGWRVLSPVSRSLLLLSLLSVRVQQPHSCTVTIPNVALAFFFYSLLCALKNKLATSDSPTL